MSLAWHISRSPLQNRCSVGSRSCPGHAGRSALTLLFFIHLRGIWTWSCEVCIPAGPCLGLQSVEYQGPSTLFAPHVCGSLSVPGCCVLRAGLLVRDTGRWGFLCGSSTCLLNSDFYINVTTSPLRFIPWSVFVLSILSHLPEFQKISCWCCCF